MFPGVVEMQKKLTQIWARVGAFDDGVFAGVVQDWAFGQRDVRRDASDWYSAIRNNNSWSSDNVGLRCEVRQSGLMLFLNLLQESLLFFFEYHRWLKALGKITMSIYIAQA